MKPVVHSGYMRDGRLHCQSFRLALAELDGENVELTVRKAGTRQRSNPQNAYLHWMFTFIARAMTDREGNSYTMEEVKSWLKYKELMYERVTPDGEVLAMVKDTRELSKEEAGEFIERCVRRMAIMGIVVPLPGEQVTILA